MRAAVLDDYQNVALSSADWSRVTDRIDVTVFNDHLRDLKEVAERLVPFEVICAMRERTAFPRELFERLPDLGLLITTGMRNASFDMAAAKEHGVTVCGTLGLGYPTAELTWGLIHALTRQIHTEDRAVREGKWQTTVGIGLQGKVMGLLGLGRLGSQVAKVANAFGMEVIAWSQNLTEERAAEHDARLVTKEELLAAADILSVHLVLSNRTRGMIGAAELASMKPTAYLINTSRGPIVEEAALVEALRAGRIAGAGLDVFDEEPLPADHPLLAAPNVVLTPHLGYVTKEGYEIFFDHTVECIDAWLRGEPVRVIE